MSNNNAIVRELKNRLDTLQTHIEASENTILTLSQHVGTNPGFIPVVEGERRTLANLHTQVKEVEKELRRLESKNR